MTLVVGYKLITWAVFRDPNYTGEYIAMAPAVLGTCCKSIFDHDTSERDNAVLISRYLDDLPDWFISSNGVTSLSMNSPGAYVCTFYGYGTWPLLNL